MSDKKLVQYLDEALVVTESLKKNTKEIISISKLIRKAIDDNKSIYICGNGGSHAESEHFVAELLCTYDDKNRRPISAFSLNSNSSSLSAWSNDFDYVSFLKRSIEAHCKKDDILFILTTSGGSEKNNQSKNILIAAKSAKKKGMKIVVLTGKSGGDAIEYSDLHIHIKSHKTSYIQEAHLKIIHMICELLEQN